MSRGDEGIVPTTGFAAPRCHRHSGAPQGDAVAKQSLAACVMCVGVLILAPAISTAQTREAESQLTVTVQGVVDAIDYTGRTVTIRGPQGNVVTLDVPANAGRFEQIKVGDTVTATYYDRISLRLKPAGEPAVDRTEEITATAGALPGATRTRQRVATVTITGWSPVDKIVTFIAPNGLTYSRRLLDTTDPTIVEGLKVGDRVDVTRTEALTVSVQSSGLSATIDDFRQRLTVSALIGWDNQFSGKIIKESTGQTTRGAVPINLGETTYDEVYGRIGMFKIGVGYRTTPRAEAVFNFVWSSSDSEDGGVQIGTVGASPPTAIPLTVIFTSFKYWGLEAGQRWFFARTRFTPFVGYLVGANRHQDIRGTFINVPLELTPALAAQDGKFFEKSWAISLGPTGGVLFGVGPFEVMAETQLRFMGGLSDVDWLVEQGLRDINTDSSRWSFPILLGARIRFP
jgi:hypothetical protein